MPSISREQLRSVVAEVVKQAMAENETLRNALNPAAVNSPEPVPVEYRAPWTGQVYSSASHPSQLQFNVAESTQSLQHELLDFLATQACSIEKNKPCDHCGLCRSLGF